MTPLDLELGVLVLVAALMHAVWNALVKASGDRVLTFALVAATGSAMAATAAPFVTLPAAPAWPFLLISVAIHNGYYVFLLLAYRRGDLSQVYPVARGAAPLVVAILAALAAGEVPAGASWAAIALTSAGIVGLAFADGWPGHAAPARTAAKPDLGPILVALATSLFIAGYTVVDGLGMRRAGSPWGYIVWLNLIEGVPFALAAVVRRRGRIGGFLGRRWLTGVAGGALATLAYAIVLYALGRGPMAHVSALRETSVLFAALIGSHGLGEPFGRRRLACAGAIAAGVILLQFL